MSQLVHTPQLVFSRASSLVIMACFSAGLLLALTGTGFAVSGLGTSGPAVLAQYPDARDLAPNDSASRSNVPSLGGVIVTSRRKAQRNPKAAAGRRANALRVERVELPSSGALDVSQSGSIPLLLISIAILSVGGILRWRRGGVPHEEDLPGGGAGSS